MHTIYIPLAQTEMKLGDAPNASLELVHLGGSSADFRVSIKDDELLYIELSTLPTHSQLL